MLDNPNATWTPEQVETLTTLWNNGLSAGDIAKEMACGFSRSAIISKVHRLKLDKRGQTGNKIVKPKAHGNLNQPKANAIVASVRAMRSRLPTPIDDEVDVGIDASHLVGIMDLNDSRCRWPMGSATGSAQKFCGVRKSRHAGPYCPEHTRKSEYQR